MSHKAQLSRQQTEELIRLYWAGAIGFQMAARVAGTSPAVLEEHARAYYPAFSLLTKKEQQVLLACRPKKQSLANLSGTFKHDPLYVTFMRHPRLYPLFQERFIKLFGIENAPLMLDRPALGGSYFEEVMEDAGEEAEEEYPDFNQGYHEPLLDQFFKRMGGGDVQSRV